MPAGGHRTRGPAVAAYAVRTVVRNRRSTSTALLGLTLGVAVIIAPWVAIDSTMRGLVDWYLDGIAVDAYALGGPDELVNASAAVRAVEHVRRVEAVYNAPVELNVTPARESISTYLVEPTFSGVLDRLGLSWDVPPTLGEVVLPYAVTSRGVRVWDTVSLDIITYRWDNGTYVEERRSSQYVVSGFYNVTRPERGFTSPMAFLASADLSRFRTDLNLTGFLPVGGLFVWLDRGALIDAFDPGGTSQRLQRQRILMENALFPNGYSVWFGGTSRGVNLESIPGTLEGRTIVLRLMFTGLTLPSLGLALLLARVGFDVGLASRRREIAVLRSRGLSVRGVRGFFSVEAGVLAVVGGLVGLGLGIVLSRMFLAAALFALPASVPVGEFALSFGTLLFAIAFGALLSFGSSWRVIRLLSSEDIVAVLKVHHAEEVSVPHRASRDFLMAGVAVAGILLLLASASVKGSPFSPLLFLLGISTAILAPVAPFLLTIAIARYLTRGTTRPYRVLARALRPVIGEVHPLVERNLVRSPRRSSNLAMIVTFAVGFVLAILILAASSEAYRAAEVTRATPSEVVAEWFNRGDGSWNLTERLTAIRAISGIAAVTPITVDMQSDRGVVVVFEASTYVRTVPWVTARDLGGVEPGGLMAALDRGDTFAANSDFQAAWGVQPGDSLYFLAVLGASVTLRLAGSVSEIPGLYAYYSGETYTRIAYMDLSALPPTANLSAGERGRFLIALQPGADSTDVAETLRTSWSDLDVRTMDETRAQMQADPFANAIFGFLTSQGQLATGMAVVAIALFVFSASASRREELATLVARGFGPRLVAALLMAEGWVVGILGILLGLVGAFAISWTVLSLAEALNPTRTPVPFVVPVAVLLPLGLVALGIIVATWLGTIAIRRMDVVRVLKLRGG